MVVDRIALLDEKAQTMAEYVILLGLITVGVVTTISLLSNAVQSGFQRTLDLVSSVI
jgi:Flp pilus assembly pilin Flp